MSQKKYDSNINAFFALLRAGLWETEVQLCDYGAIDYSAIMNMAEEQSVVGLLTAGIERVTDVKVPQDWTLQLIGSTLLLEKRNKEMNTFIAKLIGKMREKGICTLLLKGQGIAQCYEKPLWRACGDVDLFLSDDNYEKTKAVLMPMVSSVDGEYVREKHLGMTIDGWVVELHGRLYSGLSQRIEKELDKVYTDTFNNGMIRSWDNNKVQVFQLAVENDVFYVFTHILQHFFKEGVGLRQVCDWCRLLWTYHEKFDVKKVESKVCAAGLLSEWKAFASCAVEFLGMPVEAMPMYDSSSKWGRKAHLINHFIMDVGNMGHNRDKSYFRKYPYFFIKCISMYRRTIDLINHARIFPLDSLRFSYAIIKNGLKSAIRGEG